MNIRNALIVLSIALVAACGDKQNATQNTNVPSTNTPKKETPEQCYERAYERAKEERKKDLTESGEKGPFSEQELVPQGVRMILQEDCGVKG